VGVVSWNELTKNLRPVGPEVRPVLIQDADGNAKSRPYWILMRTGGHLGPGNFGGSSIRRMIELP